MKTKFALLFTVALVGTLGFTSCGDKCWRCKVWHIKANGSGWEYIGTDELCKTDTYTINHQLDTHKNDSTDGWECEKFYK